MVPSHSYKGHAPEYLHFIRANEWNLQRVISNTYIAMGSPNIICCYSEVNNNPDDQSGKFLCKLPNKEIASSCCLRTTMTQTVFHELCHISFFGIGTNARLLYLAYERFKKDAESVAESVMGRNFQYFRTIPLPKKYSLLTNKVSTPLLLAIKGYSSDSFNCERKLCAPNYQVCL
jgi:hypothetical protein